MIHRCGADVAVRPFSSAHARRTACVRFVRWHSTGLTISGKGDLQRNENKRTNAGNGGARAGAAVPPRAAASCRARDQLNKGVQSYKNAKYEEAINHFQQAVSLDPSLLNARLYLATAFAQQYIPGVDAEDNNRMGENAIDQYKAVLERDPKNINSVKGIAYLYLQMKKFEDAKTYLPQGD